MTLGGGSGERGPKKRHEQVGRSRAEAGLEAGKEHLGKVEGGRQMLWASSQ